MRGRDVTTRLAPKVFRSDRASVRLVLPIFAGTAASTQAISIGAAIRFRNSERLRPLGPPRIEGDIILLSKRGAPGWRDGPIDVFQQRAKSAWCEMASAFRCVKRRDVWRFLPQSGFEDVESLAQFVAAKVNVAAPGLSSGQAAESTARPPRVGNPGAVKLSAFPAQIA